MRLHVVDATYELFRAFFGAPPAKDPDGREVGATRGILRTLLQLLRSPDVTHVACAFDTVIESFRNRLFDGYKRGEGIEPELLAQFPLAERAADALGIVVWSMTEFEADDALATAAARWGDADGVERVLLCSPDKDLTQCVRGDHVVCLDRRKRVILDADGVVEKFGVTPASIPDWLAAVGDAADGIPGIPKWGAKSTATVLHHYVSLDAVPDDSEQWAVTVRGAKGLAASLAAHREEVALYRTLATLRTDVPLGEELDDLEWRGADRHALTALCTELGFTSFLDEIPRWR